ncbi:hypothetical protein CXF72_15155 [Psychromonas sp. MB-3u-54]|uniref:type VI secretion system Vgr family protein n=1 Tax=Psychromonas sp. MB-3u-54 TaxID=2058319 RepID=UPI000C33A451|nr:type VI secretion system tip protein TssI/VgrG [Psychromonas sp. MB-3u-54]PKH01786.1 hypothetical protein CXF72_15155 [Psychromonas sp. MB-3u-54]
MSQYHFKFICQDHDSQDSELTLLKFSGQEGISRLFNFTLELKSSDLNLDEDSLLDKPCRIEIYDGEQAKPIRIIHGLVNEFEDINYLPDCTLYRANIVPRIWQLGLFETNEVYLNETIERTLSVILEEAGFIEGQDFRFELARTYRKWPFRLQYNETHLDYLQRIIEREGIYYYFEQSDNAEVIVFADNNQALPSIAQPDQSNKIVFQANSGINVASKACTVTNIICKRQTLPKKVTLRDFNDETPSLDIRGEYIINNRGMGEINLYGLNITSPEEGQQLAEIHANAYLSRQKVYIGESDAATMAVGHTFKLADHPRDKFNQLTYLLDSIDHEGTNLNQYQELHPETDLVVNYSNSFTALSTEHEFAPKRQTVAPEINGTLNAVIDAEADSGYAELDTFGRYKVKLPFDRKDRNGGKASHWVRMMQPYGGANEGMHFPLRNGTRVLLGFIGGDPDRPFISGTINDSGEQQSIVTAENQTNNLIKTASGNKIELEDKEGKNRIKLQTGDNKTYMHLGAPNHAGSGFVLVTAGIERIDVSGGLRHTYTVGSSNYIALPSFLAAETYKQNDKVKFLNKVYKSLTAGNIDNSPDTATTHWQEQVSYDLTAIRDPEDKTSMFNFSNKSNITNAGGELLNTNKEISGKYLVERKSGPQYNWNSGEQYNFYSTGRDYFPNNQSRHYYFGNHWEVSCSRLDEEAEVSGPSDVVNTMISFGLDGIKQYEKSGDIPIDDLDTVLTTKVTSVFDLAKTEWTAVVSALATASPQIDLECVNSGMDAIKNAAGVSLHTIMSGAPTHYYQESEHSPYVLHYKISSEQKHSFTIIQDNNVESVRGQFNSLSTIHGRIAAKLSEILDAKITAAPAITAAEITVPGYSVDVVNARFDELKQALKTQCLGNIGGVLMPIFQDEGDDDNEAKDNVLGFELTSRSRECFTASGITAKKDDYRALFEGIKTGAITHIKSNLNNIFSNEQAAKIEDLTKWSKLLSWSKVQVARTDSFNLQEGNIFDFGGYWNYNLGNSYAENYMAQSVNINQKEDRDLTDVGGPDWSKLTIPRSYFDKVTPPSNMSWYCSDGVWVEKTFEGKSYEFNYKKHSIEVSNRCNSVEVSIGGSSHEVKFNGNDVKTFESKSGGGISEEWKSTPTGSRTEYEKVDMAEGGAPGKVTETRVSTYGNPTSYEIVSEPAPGSKFSFKGDGLPTLEMKMEIDVGSTVLSTHIGVMNNSVTMDATAMINSVSIDAAVMKNEVSISGCPLETEIGIGPAGLKKFETDLPGFKLTAAMVALKVRQEAAVDIAAHKVVIKQKLAEIDKGTVSLGARACDLRNNLITLLN